MHRALGRNSQSSGRDAAGEWQPSLRLPLTARNYCERPIFPNSRLQRDEPFFSPDFPVDGGALRSDHTADGTGGDAALVDRPDDERLHRPAAAGPAWAVDSLPELPLEGHIRVCTKVCTN